jgi:hypothetical protein
MRFTNLELFFMAKESPILEYLAMIQTEDGSSQGLTFLETLQAPHLRHLSLSGFALSAGSRLLTTAVSLVELCFFVKYQSTYIQPNTLLQWISLMPQLEKLAIDFLVDKFDIPNHDLERQLMYMPVMPPVTLPNLHYFNFRGVSTYLEALVHRITAPRLQRLRIDFFDQHTFSALYLPQFMNTTENLRLNSARFVFSGRQVYVEGYPYGVPVPEMYALHIAVDGFHLAQQVSSAAQISIFLSQMFSAVKHLTLVSEAHEEHNEVDHSSEWRKLLRPFSNVQTLLIDDELVDELSHALELDDGELPEIMPELQELMYSGSGDTFTSFIDARQNGGRPIALFRRSPTPDSTYFEDFETSSTTSGSSEASIYFDD